MIEETRLLETGKLHRFSFFTQEEMEADSFWMHVVIDDIVWNNKTKNYCANKIIIEYYFESLLKEVAKCFYKGHFISDLSTYGDGISVVYRQMMRFYPNLKFAPDTE